MLIAPRPATTQVIDPAFLDPTFNAVVPDEVHAIAVQADGRILIGGWFGTPSDDFPQHALARLLPNGSLDISFAPEVVWVDHDFPPEPNEPDVRSTDVSAVLETTNGVPIVLERAMYLKKPTQPFAAGHGSAAVTAPGANWFFAEGATGPFFDEFVLLANPNLTAAVVPATFLLPNGETLFKDYTVKKTSRFTIWVDEETFPGLGKALANTAVSITLESTNGVTFIAEPAMWWPGPTPATWSRFNVPVLGEFPQALGKRFGAIIESLGPNPVQLVVERAMY